MPIYAGEQYTREDLEELAKKNVCAVCGECLDIYTSYKGGWDKPPRYYLACHDYRRTQHEGIAKEASPYQQRGLESLNISTRREKMEETYGEKTTTALMKFEGVKTLTKPDLNEIFTLIYPKAPKAEVNRAVLLSLSYGLNPLMGHVYLIPFKSKKDEKVYYSTVMGIKATRLLANRRGPVSYIDDTPRLMTEEEQKRVYGAVDKGHIHAITILKDMATGAEARGYGKWPVGKGVQGEDKGNSPLNMAFIRSERQAIDRLRPGEMPSGVDVVDEKYMPKVEEPEESQAEPESQEEGPMEAEFEELPPQTKQEKPKPKKAPPAKATPAKAPAAKAPEAEAELVEEAPPDESQPPKTVHDLLERIAIAKSWNTTQYCKTWILNNFKHITPEMIEGDPGAVWLEIQPHLTGL